MQIDTIGIGSVIPYARNPRRNGAAISKVAASLQEFGWRQPIVVDAEMVVVAGHTRLEAARSLGMAEVPVHVATGLTPEQIKAYRLADNRVGQEAEWDEELLRLELGELEGMDFALDLTGFDSDELLELMADPFEEGQTDPDEVPDAPEEPVTQRGDVWLLGKHRLVCGDSTNANDVENCMDGKKADLVLTDPPYGLGAGKESGKNDYTGYDDTRENLIELAKDWLPMAQSVAHTVVFSPGVTNQWLYPEPDWVFCWFYGGGQLRSSWGFNCWQPFLCYGKDPSLASGHGGRPDAVDMNTPANAKDIDHPCPKPIKLWEWLLNRLVFSPTAVLFEPFGGSGTTIIAAEMRGISCHAIELSPEYCDVIVQRWENFTGKTAKLDRMPPGG
tara:strand:- start:189 stop:1352 length:1164 start_codon:yes stop_codon:yes gene_type:complete